MATGIGGTPPQANGHLMPPPAAGGTGQILPRACTGSMTLLTLTVGSPRKLTSKPVNILLSFFFISLEFISSCSSSGVLTLNRSSPRAL